MACGNGFQRQRPHYVYFSRTLKREIYRIFILRNKQPQNKVFFGGEKIKFIKMEVRKIFLNKMTRETNERTNIYHPTSVYYYVRCEPRTEGDLHAIFLNKRLSLISNNCPNVLIYILFKKKECLIT